LNEGKRNTAQADRRGNERYSPRFNRISEQAACRRQNGVSDRRFDFEVCGLAKERSLNGLLFFLSCIGSPQKSTCN